jgi:peptidoglycan/LPS O-acetylase OafA/YrhL
MITETSPHTQLRIEELESIRGLAALLVVFVHIPKWNPVLDIGIINNAYLMVDLFFVLSGFVIFNAYSNKIDSKTDLLRFQFLRLGRLYPVHLFYLLLFLAIEIARYIATELGMQNLRAMPFSINNIGALIEQIFLVQAIGPTGNALTFNGPAWSISVEFYTYLIFGLIVLFLGKIRNSVFCVLALVSIVMLLTKTTWGFAELLRCLAGFFVGCLTANFVQKVKTPMHVPNYTSLLLFAAIVIFLQTKTTKDFDVVIYLLTSALIFSLILTRDGILNKILNYKILTWLGLISYSVYMCHGLVLWIISAVLKRLLGRAEIQGADGRWQISLSTTETLAGVIIIVFLVLVVGQITYSVIEKPLREKSRRLVFSATSAIPIPHCEPSRHL